MDANDSYDVLIVGGGHAGTHVATALRQNEFAGSIGLVTDDLRLPYERPPLSKDYLLGKKRLDEILIRPAAFWAERDIDVALGCPVTHVDAGERTVALADGRILRYATLVWAAGGVARQWSGPGAELSGVHSMRGVEDIDRITDRLATAYRVCIIGGGYIGLEAAAAMRQLGKHVTLLETADRVLARVAGNDISQFVEAKHRSEGVDLRTGVSVAGIAGSDGEVTAVRLVDGSDIVCEMVIVGIGMDPVVQPLLDAGARIENGVVVDAHCRASVPGVYAVGDCVARLNRFADDRAIRLESVHNATDQANIAARDICGLDYEGETVPWFWSNQYDMRLQTVGLSSGYDETIVRGDVASGHFSVVYLKQGSVLALDCVNSTKDYAAGRSLIGRNATPWLDQLRDVGTPLKELARDADARDSGKGGKPQCVSFGA